MDNELLDAIQKLLEGSEQRNKTTLEALEARLGEKIYDTETSLMRAFSQW